MSQILSSMVAHLRRAPPQTTAEAKSDEASEATSNRIDEEVNCAMDAFEAMQEALEKVLNLLKPMLRDGQHDEAMACLALSPSEFVEPLSKHEVQVLACALYVEAKEKRSISYADILCLTRQYGGREMNITMVYETIKRLSRADRQLIALSGSAIHAGSDRPSKFYSITELGRAAFKMAILNARLLGGKPTSHAA